MLESTPDCYGRPSDSRECVLCTASDACYQKNFQENSVYLLPNAVEPTPTKKVRGAGYATEDKANLPWEKDAT
jgi:hypothetical protein